MFVNEKQRNIEAGGAGLPTQVSHAHRTPLREQPVSHAQRAYVDLCGAQTYYLPVMVASFPDSVDAWRMVSSRRSFSGRLPIERLGRLCEALADSSGEVAYALEFGCDEHRVSYVDVIADTALQLTCQRTLRPFAFPLKVKTRLGMIRQEQDEAGLPPDYEPLLVPSDGRIKPADLIEEELLLALPLVPIDPDSSEQTVASSLDSSPADADARENPFAALRELKS